MFTAERVPIQRPWALLFASAALAASSIAAFGGLMNLRSDMSRRPVLVLRQVDQLAVALRDGPFVASPPTATEGAPGVWLIGALDCAGCAESTADALQALEDQAIPVFVMLANEATQDLTAETVLRAAAIARSGDVSSLRPQNRSAQTPQAVLDGPAEVEGYAVWADQTADRVTRVLAENGLEAAPPVLVWRRGDAFLALSRANGQSVRHVLRDRQPMRSS